MRTGVFRTPVPTANPNPLTPIANRLILAPDERSLRIDLVRLDRTVQVAGCVGSRDPGRSTPTQRAAAQIPEAIGVRQFDRLVFAGLYRVAPGVLDALKILKPQTVIRWHRAGFRTYWRWKSRPRGGRPKTPADIRQLIRDMSAANPLWGAPRIHGELLKLGIDVGQ